MFLDIRLDRMHHAFWKYCNKEHPKYVPAVIAAFISPYRNMRGCARKETTNFVEIFLNCSVETCAKRDPKGPCKKASAGQIKDLTGPQGLYEEPLQPYW